MATFFLHSRDRRRFLRALVGVAAALTASIAVADGSCPAGQVGQVTYQAQGLSGYADPAQLCMDVGARVSRFTIATSYDPSGPSCKITTGGGGYNPEDFYYSVNVYSTCVTPPPPTCTAGDGYKGGKFQYAWDGSGEGVLTACAPNGCEQQSAGQSYSGKGSSGAGYTIWSGAVNTGNTCTAQAAGSSPEPSPVPPDAPQPPPPGQCDGTVNGVTVRVNCNSTASSSSSSSSSASGGSNSSDGGSNPNGSPGDQSTKSTSTQCTGTACTTTITTTTTHADGSKDTTTTKTSIDSSAGQGSSTTTKSGSNADGSSKPTSTASDDGSKDDVCKSHPDAALCKPSGTASNGDCPAPDTCSGDAVACAILTESHVARCAEQKRFDDLTGQSYTDLGVQALAGNDPMTKAGNPASAGLTPDTALVIDMTNDTYKLNQDGFFGGNSANCFNDKSVTFAGRTLAIPMSQLCGPMSVLPPIMIIVCGLISVGILYRAVQGA